MKYSSIFKKKIGCNNDKEVFVYLMNNLNYSIRYWDYFVNWKKVIGNTKDLEVVLNILNYLIGKENIEKEFGYLLKNHPQVVRLIPVLLACREHKFKILTDLSEGNLKYEDFSFEENRNLSDAEISKAIRFAQKSGLLRILLSQKKIHHGQILNSSANEKNSYNRSYRLYRSQPGEVLYR